METHLLSLDLGANYTFKKKINIKKYWEVRDDLGRNKMLSVCINLISVFGAHWKNTRVNLHTGLYIKVFVSISVGLETSQHYFHLLTRWNSAYVYLRAIYRIFCQATKTLGPRVQSWSSWFWHVVSHEHSSWQQIDAISKDFIQPYARLIYFAWPISKIDWSRLPNNNDEKYPPC